MGPDSAEYHRTFLPRVDLRSDPLSVYNLSHDSNRAWYRAVPRWFVSPGFSFLQPRSGRHAAQAGAPQQPVHGRDRGRFLTAYQMAGGELRQIIIAEKADQLFSNYATGFEARYSKLCRSASWGAMDPVVDEKLMVVGHLGTVSGEDIVVPEDAGSFEDYIGELSSESFADDRADPTVDYINELVGDEVPVYVLDPKSAPDGRLPGYKRPLSYDVRPTVLTGIDGEVLACRGSSVRYNDAPDPYLEVASLALAVATGGAKLGAGVGKRIAKSLSRKSAAGKLERVFAGATRAGLDEFRRSRRAFWGRLLRKRTRGYLKSSGMLKEHFELVQLKAREQRVIVLVRNTNEKCMELIRKRCPGKPPELSFLNTHRETGIVTIKTRDEAKQVFALGKGHYVVQDGVPVRPLIQDEKLVIRDGKQVMEELRLKPGQEKLWNADGQVIDGQTGMPFTGDYDLMAVFKPAQRRRWAALVAKAKKGEEALGAQTVKDVRTPEADAFIQVVNPKLDRPRLLHGAQEQYGGIRGSCTAFFPDGRVIHLEEDEVRLFYEVMQRKTRAGSWAQAAAR